MTLGDVDAFAELDEANAPETTAWLKSIAASGWARHPQHGKRPRGLPRCRRLEARAGREPDDLPNRWRCLVYYKPAIFVEPEWPRATRDFLVVSFIYERDSAVRGISTALATNVVGMITEGLDALAHEAPRMRREGMGQMRIELA